MTVLRKYNEFRSKLRKKYKGLNLLLKKTEYKTMTIHAHYVYI